MSQFFGTEIFWITLVITPLLLALLTLVGFFLCRILIPLPNHNSSFYLFPAIGLSVMIIISSVIGRLFPLGNFSVSIFIIAGIIILVLICEKNIYQILAKSLVVSIFGIVCGISILVPLFFYGGFNSHNDTFTYLAHSNWLQNHSFNEKVSLDTVTPSTTQISLYQSGGLRMGGSFFLALSQALFNLEWAYDAYPAVLITIVSACCLAIGFPIAVAFVDMRRNMLLILLSLPALSLGGLVFGANFGFLPQTIGLALGVGFLAVVGFSLNLIIEKKISIVIISKLAFLSALLFSGVVFAYSEIIPFLALACLISGLVFMMRFFVFKNILIFSSLIFIFSVLLLNFEILRAMKALLSQASAIVGTPVDWLLVGYISHAFGIHGGAWDLLQWSNNENIKYPAFFVGLLFMIVIAGVMFFSRQYVWKFIKNGILMPFFATLIIFSLFFLYFRYFVSSPFSIGTGQSWSQFKLSDWANPFLMVLLLFSFATFQFFLSRIFNVILIVIFVICLIINIPISMDRIKPFVNGYGKVKNIAEFYVNFRNKVNDVCSYDMPVYLNLNDSDLKFRQMASLYLYDRKLESNWTNDGYIYFYLPSEDQNKKSAVGSCVIESSKKNDLLDLEYDNRIGLFNIGIFQENKRVQISKTISDYEEESDGKNYWNWVKNEITFNLNTSSIMEDYNQTKIFFEYDTRGSQILNLSIIKKDGTNLSFSFSGKGDMLETFEKIIDLPSSQITAIIIETDGTATRLSKNDPRLANFIIKNLNIEQYKKSK